MNPTTMNMYSKETHDILRTDVPVLIWENLTVLIDGIIFHEDELSCAGQEGIRPRFEDFYLQ